MSPLVSIAPHFSGNSGNDRGLRPEVKAVGRNQANERQDFGHGNYEQEATNVAKACMRAMTMLT